VSEAAAPPASATVVPPAWATDRRGVLAALPRRARRLLERWVLCRGDKVAYLRRLGVRIGDRTAILCRVEDFGTEPWLVEIGSRVSIAAGVVFITHDGASRVVRDRIPGGSPYGNCFAPIRVRDNSMVGLRAILMPGVTIGPDSIVGAGSLVTHSVPAGTVACGVPARVVSTIEQYAESYRRQMIPGLSSDRAELRRQLTRRFWGEER
jgi:acetyltransferase-like isoleucine patch superfamily enzyme